MKTLLNIYLYFIFIFVFRKILGSLLSRLKNRYEYIPQENSIDLLTDDLYGFEFTNILTTSTKPRLRYKSLSYPYEDLYDISPRKEPQADMDSFDIIQYTRNTKSYEMFYKSRGKTSNDLFIPRATIGWSRKTKISSFLKRRKTFPTYFPTINIRKTKSEVVENRNTTFFIRSKPTRTKVITIKPRFSLNWIHKKKTSTKNQSSTNSNAVFNQLSTTTTTSDYLNNKKITTKRLTGPNYLNKTSITTKALTGISYFNSTSVTTKALTGISYFNNTSVTTKALTGISYFNNTSVTKGPTTTFNTNITMNELNTPKYLDNTTIDNDVTNIDHLNNTSITINGLTTTEYLNNTTITTDGLTVTANKSAEREDIIKSSCYYCGLNISGLPMPFCHKIFDDADQRWRRRQHRLKIKCFKNSATYSVQNRYYSPQYRGGCFKRYLDIGGAYNERGCRKTQPETGSSYASIRLARLEMVLDDVEEGCVASPHASLTPFSRPISLFVRYHVCVCNSKYCNRSSYLTCISLHYLLSLALIINYAI